MIFLKNPAVMVLHVVGFVLLVAVVAGGVA